MSRQYVSEQEAAFLALMARRVLNRRREAASRGEQYHDLSPAVPVACGVRVKLRFVEMPGGYEAEVELREDPRYSPEEHQQIASEVIGHPVERIDISTDGAVRPNVLFYRRKP